MMPILYTLAILSLTVSVILSVPKIVDQTQTLLTAANVPNNLVLGKPQVAGIAKMNPLPKNLGMPAPILSAASVLALDLDSGFIFFAKDPARRLPIASTTKIMTALIASDRFGSNEVLTVPDLSGIQGSNMGLKSGEKITLRSLLYGMLLSSGNDAAFTIAANFPGGVPAFTAAMNQKAEEMGLAGTHFDNPAGFDSPNHYSSANDLAKIALQLPDNLQLLRVVGTKEASVASVDRTVVHNLKNLNKLLGTDGVLGIKTGFTPVAKENLVALAQRDGHEVLTILLGSDDRFGETKSLLEWIYSNFTWK